ncbi:DoxX family membrane protein [Candidatus Nomurabacteria bacterium]|nr:DoxX family membrane protein [Candidatus Nomurabacteria bacterium]
MLNPFPIQFLALFAYFILRVTIAVCLLHLGTKHWRVRDELQHVLRLSWFPYGRLVATLLPLGELSLGLLLLAGAHTQYAALAVIAMSIKLLLLRNYFSHPSIPEKLFYFLLLGATTTLFVTGAGVPAFDLPL